MKRIAAAVAGALAIEAAHKRHIRQLLVSARARVPAPSEAPLTLQEQRAIALIADRFSVRLIGGTP